MRRTLTKRVRHPGTCVQHASDRRRAQKFLRSADQVRHNGWVADVSPDRQDPAKAVPPAPMPRDKQGWRVAPAPDGRGMPDEHKPAPPHRWRGFWILVFVLLAINWLSVLMTQSSGQTRVKVPFSPYFLSQVDAGKVKSISSKGDTINGTFTTKVAYPPGDKKVSPPFRTRPTALHFRDDLW